MQLQYRSQWLSQRQSNYLQVIKAKEPRLQNEIERASDRDAIADAMPTKEVKIADIAIPTMINVKEESDPLIDANLKVSAVVSKAPTGSARRSHLMDPDLQQNQ
jgi:hypothetical protein